MCFRMESAGPPTVIALVLLFLLQQTRVSGADQLGSNRTSGVLATEDAVIQRVSPVSASQSRHSPRSAELNYEPSGSAIPVVVQQVKGLSDVFSRFSLVSKRVQNELCRNHSAIYLQQLDNFTLWAVEMFDASTKFPEGLVAGNTFQLGVFDECVGVKAQLPGDGHFKGQYCLADVQIIPPETDSSFHTYEYIKDPNGSAWEGLKFTADKRVRRRDVFHWSFCIPSSCGARDLQAALEEAFEWVERQHGISMAVEVQDRMCQTKGLEPMTNGDIAVAVIMSLFVVAVVAGTIFDFCTQKKRKSNGGGGVVSRVAMCFSARSNLRSLMTTNISKGELKAIHGVRFYSMMLIIFGHRCMFSFGGPLHNPRFVEYIYTEAINMFLLNGPLIVDTFFLISGLLTSYLLILELEKKKKYNIFVLYLYRYIRLTPVYIIIVAFYATLFRRMGEGPLWDAKVGLEAERCQTNWWTNLLYLNNYVNTSQLCMFQSWYVTCDMHFFLMAPLLVYPLWRWPRYGRVALLLVTLASVCVPFAVTYIGQLDGVLLLYMTTLSDPVVNNTFRSVYITSHTRASPYFIGMMWGYIYYKIKTEKIKIPQFTILGLWAVLLTTALASMFGAWIFYLPGRPYSALESAFYGGLHRAGWGLSIGWLVVSSDIGLAGPLVPLFKWNAVVPLSRLTYCAFLIHGGVQLFSIATLRTPEYMTFWKLFWMTSADIFFTFMIAVLVTLIFESPICGLQRIFLRGGNNAEKETKAETVLVSYENGRTMTIPQ
ncbi:nose resistant to fluoxetine protein 6-like [Ischnura elegans]|uniref:nose resistant to fluoxetine protein 6-like n=1 Tax=Ischnura elegans TaxID=197161 RepID=UPI001ED899CD|nr:nose resistant to fluoxetine protein 6-like [Ischnura elegans]